MVWADVGQDLDAGELATLNRGCRSGRRHFRKCGYQGRLSVTPYTLAPSTDIIPSMTNHPSLTPTLESLEAEKWEQRRLARLEKLKTTNPAGLSKAERLKAIEDNRARKAAEKAVRLKRRRPRRDRSNNGNEAPHEN